MVEEATNLDKARFDSARFDHARFDVTRPDWDKLIKQLENVTTHKLIVGGTPVAVGGATYRVNVFVDVWEELLKTLENVT